MSLPSELVSGACEIPDDEGWITQEARRDGRFGMNLT